MIFKTTLTICGLKLAVIILWAIETASEQSLGDRLHCIVFMVWTLLRILDSVQLAATMVFMTASHYLWVG